MATEDELQAAPTMENNAGDEAGSAPNLADSVAHPEETADHEGTAEAPEAHAEQEEKAEIKLEKADAAPGQTPPPIKGARWAEPIATFERRWTWLETRLLTFVLVWQLVSLVVWVLLAGIAIPPSKDAAGTVFRALIAAVLLGIGGWIGTRKLPLEKRRMFTMGGIVLGICIGLVLRPSFDATSGIRLAINKALALDRLDAFIVNYFSNIKGWLQEASTLTLVGGLRGLATRLTLWLALLGASLATAAGKHIHIDVIFRFLPKRLRIPAAIINFCAAATVCTAGAWGFVDHLAIESFNSKAGDTAGTKISNISHHMGHHFFLVRKQIGLDLRTLPHVLAGETYDRWMTAAQWNQWVKDGGFESHYKAEEVASILILDDSAPHTPLIVAPDGVGARGMLIHSLNFVFPFGLMVIALRFLLRAILVISGHIELDPDAAHKEELRHASIEPAKAEGGA